jgi:hypothetical protein
MKYNLADPERVAQAVEYLQRLIDSKSIAEVKKVSPTRTLNQNAYLHLLIAAYGAHFGYTLDEAKHVYKKLNHNIYAYTKNNQVFLRSSADLTTAEMAKSIDVFREKSAGSGYPLPPATDKAWLMEVENEIERSKYYL